MIEWANAAPARISAATQIASINSSCDVRPRRVEFTGHFYAPFFGPALPRMTSLSTTASLWISSFAE